MANLGGGYGDIRPRTCSPCSGGSDALHLSLPPASHCGAPSGPLGYMPPLGWVAGLHPRNSAEQNVPVQSSLKSFHVCVLVCMGLLWLQVLLIRIKIFLSGFVFFPSQITLRSNPNGKMQRKPVSLFSHSLGINKFSL